MPAEPRSTRIKLRAEPIADVAVIAVVAGFAGVLDLVNSTGEIVPQQIPEGFQRSQLLGIDRVALDPGLYHEKAELFSSLGLIALASYAAFDPIWTGLREGHVQAGIVDGLVYAQAIAISWGLTNLAKVAVRRPRPQAYYDAERGADDPDYSNPDTGSALSFFSGHASITATISSTATYLAFIRSPGTARPWITLALGTAVTTFVSIERVRARAHFPTDVIAGAVAGVGIGILVPHLHRTEPIEQRDMWIGFQPQPRARGGSVTVGGLL